MIQISLPALLTIIGLFGSFLVYVGRAENRLGKFEERTSNMKQQMDRIESAVNKLYDRDYENIKS